MNDLVLMRVPQRFSGAADDMERPLQRELSFAVEAVLHTFTIHKLHSEEMVPPVFADVVELDDIRVIERGRGLRLAVEAFEKGCVLNELLWKDLQSDAALEFGVFRLIDRSHATFADLSDNAIFAQCLRALSFR